MLNESLVFFPKFEVVMSYLMGQALIAKWPKSIDFKLVVQYT